MNSAPAQFPRFWMALSIALCCGAIRGGVAKAGGGSYNGPALSGPSIPVSVDRFPSFADLQGAVGSCLANLGESLWQQAYRRRPDPSLQRQIEFSYLPEHCDYSAAVTWSERKTGHSVERKGLQAAGERNVTISDNLCDPHFILQLTLPSLPIRLPRVPGVANPEGMVTSETFEFADQSGLPQLRYDETIGNGAYDEFGRLANFEAVILRNLRLQLPAAHGPAVPLRNQTTGRATSLTANVQRYSECLQSRLQQ